MEVRARRRRGNLTAWNVMRIEIDCFAKLAMTGNVDSLIKSENDRYELPYPLFGKEGVGAKTLGAFTEVQELFSCRGRTGVSPVFQFPP